MLSMLIIVTIQGRPYPPSSSNTSKAHCLVANAAAAGTVAALALIALASPAAAYHGTVDVDECGDAPTNGGDGCAKPQDEEEVLGIELVD